MEKRSYPKQIPDVELCYKATRYNSIIMIAADTTNLVFRLDVLSALTELRLFATQNSEVPKYCDIHPVITDYWKVSTLVSRLENLQITNSSAMF